MSMTPGNAKDIDTEAAPGSKPSVELKFVGPFGDDKSLLEKPVANSWVCVQDAYCTIWKDAADTEGRFYFHFAFQGETKNTGTSEQALVAPFKIHYTALIQDRQGREHTITDKVVAYDPRILQRELNTYITVIGNPTYGGVYRVPIRLKDAASIRVRLSKVDD